MVPHETAAVSAQVLCTPHNHAPCHFMQSHIRKAHACLTVTWHLHFWQNNRDLLRATAVTRGWNGYRNKSQHRKLTLENFFIPPLLQGLEPATFQSRIRRSNHWAIPALVLSAHAMFSHLHKDGHKCVWSSVALPVSVFCRCLSVSVSPRSGRRIWISAPSAKDPELSKFLCFS